MISVEHLMNERRTDVDELVAQFRTNRAFIQVLLKAGIKFEDLFEVLQVREDCGVTYLNDDSADPKKIEFVSAELLAQLYHSVDGDLTLMACHLELATDDVYGVHRNFMHGAVNRAVKRYLEHFNLAGVSQVE